MKEFDAKTYKEGKGDFNNNDEDLLVSLLQTQNPNRILDIGCGDGKLTRRIKNHLPKAKMVAIDNSRDQIGLATSTPSEIDFHLIDIADFSSDTKFDCAYSFYAFPHMPKSKLLGALKSVKQLLLEDGVFYLFTNICLFDTAVATASDQEACDIVFLNDWQSQINLVSLAEMKEMFDKAELTLTYNKRLETGAKVKNYGEMISWMFVLK